MHLICGTAAQPTLGGGRCKREQTGSVKPPREGQKPPLKATDLLLAAAIMKVISAGNVPTVPITSDFQLPRKPGALAKCKPVLSYSPILCSHILMANVLHPGSNSYWSPEICLFSETTGGLL